MSMIDAIYSLLGPDNLNEIIELAKKHPEEVNSKLKYIFEDFINFTKKVLIESTLKGKPNVLIPVIVLEVAIGKSIGNPVYLLESLNEELPMYQVSLIYSSEGNDHAFNFVVKQVEENKVA